jgi:hypothetical protein
MLVTADRIALMAQLGAYMRSEDPAWKGARERAVLANSWFTEEYIDLAIENIVAAFLDEEQLKRWLEGYPAPASSKNVGIIMAGNIPLVGFHDFLCGFMSGHRLLLKLSSKDDVLLRHLLEKLAEWAPETADQILIADMLKGCAAYIATGSNNSARYFTAYFGKYPHIIRRNRTSVAVLTGKESREQLMELGKDVFTYFGLGCRNVTQISVPEGYDFTTLLEVFNTWEGMLQHHKYRNNYDYHLALYLLNKVPYMTNGSLLLVENELPFSPVSVLHYRYYTDRNALVQALAESDDIQCIAGEGQVPFGQTQRPSLTDYPDGVDTMRFLSGL